MPTPILQLVPEVALRARSAPEETIRLALTRAADTFCRETFAWQEEADDFDLEEDRLTLSSPDKSAVVIGVMRLAVGGRKLYPVGEAAWRHGRGRRIWPPTTYYASRPDLVFLSASVLPGGEEDALASIEATVALAPATGASSWPDFLAVEHGQTIIAGALYFLLTIPGEPFFDPNTATTLYRKEFQSGVGRAKLHRHGGYSQHNLAVFPHPLAHGSGGAP